MIFIENYGKKHRLIGDGVAMELNIRLGTINDVVAVVKLYDSINDYLFEHVNYPGWRKGIYPAKEDATLGIKEGSLFVAFLENELVGSFILRNKSEKAYNQATWQKKLEDKDIYVLYTFVVSPNYLNKGIGYKLLQFAEQFGRNQGMQALRLDVFENNQPAINLYEKYGFKYIDTVDLGLEEYGLKWFKLYEKILDINS